MIFLNTGQRNIKFTLQTCQCIKSLKCRSNTNVERMLLSLYMEKTNENEGEKKKDNTAKYILKP